ncbi:sphingosine-1-phosphate phosphatase 1 [Alosa pseudoharengus]|uniref:sphingosine-1-phosphate phosphatase 1 n=1 Tax=Alosa pseudoharengus TaxID=34774 RepID=UPI003F8BCF8A
MATDLIKGVVRLCLNLQDPEHVARFQKLCGVRGTFPRKSARTEESESEPSPNGACVKQRTEESTDDGSVDEKPSDLRQRKDRSSETSKQEECSNGLLNGAAMPEEQNTLSESSSKADSERGGSKGIVKPLRKNSLTGDVGQEFIIENKFLFYLFTFGTELGNEMFFIVFFPFLMWNVDAYVSRQIIVVWVLVLFIGQSTKDLVRWTRPASPPVVKVEVFYNSEYSMPSTHAMTGTALPFSLFMLTYGRWQYPFLFGLGLAVCWSFLVCISRIYMGMHSVLEVITGFLYSVLILAVFQPLLDSIDQYYLAGSYASLVIVLVHVGLGLLAFSLDTWSTSRGDTAQALSTGAGAALASHLNHQLGLQPDPSLDLLPLVMPVMDAALLGRALARLLVGVPVLLATRAAMKTLTIPLACRVFGVPADDVRHARQHAAVELSYRYLVYGTVAFSCVFLVPLLFDYLSLS